MHAQQRPWKPHEAVHGQSDCFTLSQFIMFTSLIFSKNKGLSAQLPVREEGDAEYQHHANKHFGNVRIHGHPFHDRSLLLSITCRKNEVVPKGKNGIRQDYLACVLYTLNYV